MISEPLGTATLLLTFAVLLGVSALFGRAFERIGVPVVFAFLAIGVLAGSRALGDIAFSDYNFAFRVGVIALVVILFDGGLNTSIAAARRVLAPAGLLATLGVIGTAALVALGARLLGVGWGTALLLGAVVSSTDAAAVFSVLRGSGVQLRHRVATTLEVESGINDPVAVLLTIAITERLVSGEALSIPAVIFGGIFELAIGAVVGLLVGYGGRLLLTRVRVPAAGLVTVVVLSLAFFAFGMGTLLHGSGFVSVYVAAIILGNGPLPLRSNVLRFHDAAAWLGQITMFLFLGLLAVPERVFQQVPLGIMMALLLAFVARPVMALLLLLPLRFQPREALYIGWVGLRGAIPIVLATFPVMAGLTGGERVFDLVFVIVVLNGVLPGSTVRRVTRWLGLEESRPPAPGAVLQIEAAQSLNAELLSFYVTPALAAADVALQDLPFPEGAAVAMIVRGAELIPPKGNTVIQSGDHVYVIARKEDQAYMQLLFGRPEN